MNLDRPGCPVKTRLLSFLSVAAILLSTAIASSLPAWGRDARDDRLTDLGVAAAGPARSSPAKELKGDIGQDTADADFSLSINPDPMPPGQIVTFTVSGATPNAPGAVLFSLTGLGSTYVPQARVTLGIDRASIAFPVFTTDGNGDFSIDLTAPG